MTLLGAETEPLGSLGEAIALLDWGFALRRDAAVGRLVTPEVTPPSSFRMTGLALGAAAVLVVLLVVAAWRRLRAHPGGSGRRRR